jgi:hypothetical protein
MLNSRLENTKLHNKIDVEVKLLIDEDIKHNLIQQSLLGAIRHFNIKIEMRCRIILNHKFKFKLIV